MARLTPEQATQKWVNNLQGATQAMTQGVQSVSVAPGQVAARNAELWQQRVIAARDKWRERVASVSLSDWQQSMINVGIPRVAQGAQAKQNKMADFLREFLPVVHSNAEQVRAMPKGGLEQSIARARRMIELNAQFRRGRGTSGS